MSIPDFVNESPIAIRSEELFRPHPGEVFARRCMQKSKLKQSEVADIIGISSKHLSRFINGHVNVGADLARKLEACTDISALSWLHFQNQYDLYKTKKIPASTKLINS